MSPDISRLLSEDNEPINEDVKQQLCSLVKLLKSKGIDPRSVLTAAAIAAAAATTSGCASTKYTMDDAMRDAWRDARERPKYGETQRDTQLRRERERKELEQKASSPSP